MWGLILVPWDHDLRWRQILYQLSHPGAIPIPCFSWQPILVTVILYSGLWDLAEGLVAVCANESMGLISRQVSCIALFLAIAYASPFLPACHKWAQEIWMALHKFVATVGNNSLKWAFSFLWWISNDEVIVAGLRRYGGFPRRNHLADSWRGKQNETASLHSLACFPPDPSRFLPGTGHETVFYGWFTELMITESQTIKEQFASSLVYSSIRKRPKMWPLF